MTLDAGRDRRLPSVFLIGAPKSGTTTFAEQLRRHPKIVVSEPKEPEFFSDPHVYGQGFDWYAQLFPGAQTDQLLCDASTTYSRWPHTADCPELIRRACPDARFLYLLRHPVDRVYAGYSHRMRSGLTMTFEHALERLEVLIDGSRYDVQLQRYLEHFASDRVWVGFSKELQLDPAGTMDSAFSFLDVPPQTTENVSLNVGGYDRVVQEQLIEPLKRIPGASALRRVLPNEATRTLKRLIANSPVSRRVGDEHQPQPMSREARCRLIDLFEPTTAWIEQFTGRSLDEWRA